MRWYITQILLLMVTWLSLSASGQEETDPSDYKFKSPWKISSDVCEFYRCPPNHLCEVGVRRTHNNKLFPRWLYRAECKPLELGACERKDACVEHEVCVLTEHACKHPTIAKKYHFCAYTHVCIARDIWYHGGIEITEDMGDEMPWIH